MSIYHRYASREHDMVFEQNRKKPPSKMGATRTTKTQKMPPRPSRSYKVAATDTSVVNPISDATVGETLPAETTTQQSIPIQIPPLGIDPPIDIASFKSIAPNAAYFAGFLPNLGHILTVVYEANNHLSTISITKYGVSTYKNLVLNPTSRFWPSCENLSPEYAHSPVRRALAVSNLKNFNRLVNHPGQLSYNKYWDETDAGALASSMQLLTTRTPTELGQKLLELGLLQSHTVRSLVLDTVYDNVSTRASDTIIEENNRLVNLMGEQLDQLFDPLLEYSPEAMRISYNAPSAEHFVAPLIQNDPDITNIVGELLSVQTNFTMGLVNLLQNFVIPLRIHVLASANKQTKFSKQNTGIAKINLVFPPTIDEITRINCILHEALTRAARYGYVEVFKVMAMVLPYFYKAFIRHEANLKSFSSRLKRFSARNGKVFENQEINKGKYSIGGIESIVVDSLLEMPKLRLILERLEKATRSASSKLTDLSEETAHEIEVKTLHATYTRKVSEGERRAHFSDDSSLVDQPQVIPQSRSQARANELSLIEEYYKCAIDVIDAFGGSQLEAAEDADARAAQIEVNRHATRSRIFTPSGKLLPEITSLWPPELQHNSLTRKVVGIFELTSTAPNKLHNIDILIIFSDYLLFLTIDDNKYYLTGSQLSVADILMHSLINEKPLPEVDFPSMVVAGWCGVNDVLVSVCDENETSSGTSNDLNDQEKPTHTFLRFLNTTGGFLSPERSPTELSHKTYQCAEPHRVVELLNKAKVLHKSQPFHLFKSSGLLDIYSTAHQVDAYELENCKSPFALFLNISIDEPVRYFEEHAGLHLIVQASFITEQSIHLMAYNRKGDFVYNEVVTVDSFHESVEEIVAKNYGLMYGTFSPVVEGLSRAYADDLEYFVSVFTGYNRAKLLRYAQEEEDRQQKEILYEREKVLERVRKENEKIEIAKAQERRKQKEQARKEEKELELALKAESANQVTKKKSFISKLFKSFKKKDKKEADVIHNDKKVERRRSKLLGQISAPSNPIMPGQTESASAPQVATITPSSERKISDTYIPRGNRTEYANILAPSPDLKKAVQEVLPPSELAPKMSLRQKLSSRTLRSSAKSIEVANADTNSEVYIHNKPSNSSMKSSLKSAMKQRQISLTERNAIALDQVEERKVSQQVGPTIDLAHIPLKEFYGDGESNWTVFSRDNSSLFDDIQKLKAQEEVEISGSERLSSGASRKISGHSTHSARTSTSIGTSITTARNSTSNSAKASARVSTSASSNDSIDYSKTTSPVAGSFVEEFEARFGGYASMSTFEVPRNYFQKEDSIQSLTSTQAIEEFKKNIHFDDSLDIDYDDLGTIGGSRKLSIVETDEETDKERESSSSELLHFSDSDQHEVAKRYAGVVKIINLSSLTLTSSEDEFYSPDEFEFNTDAYSKQNAEKSFVRQPLKLNPGTSVDIPIIMTPTSQTNTSLSSEATIINEPSRSHLHRSVTDKDLAIPRDSSIAYLSGILDGTLEIESFK